MPTPAEATLIADTRLCVAELMEIVVQHTTALSISNRYADLIRVKGTKTASQKAENAITAHASKYTPLFVCALIDDLLFSHTEGYKQIGCRCRRNAVNLAFGQRRSFPMSYDVGSDH